jgi:hypothetical protein
MRAAVSAAIDYGLEAIELGEERSPPPPPTLLAQARLAARNGVGLDAVLRRYVAGHAVLGDFLVDGVERVDLDGVALKRLLRTQATLFDRLLEAVSEEHGRELGGRFSTDEQRQAERVKRLLAGELIDTAALNYELGAHHLAAIAAGPGAAAAIRRLAGGFDRRLLLACPEDGIAWAWLGARRAVAPGELERFLGATLSPRLSLALGEPAAGLAGWRLTHQQARAALQIARRSPGACVRYADVALRASLLQDDLLATSLRQMYLAPLEEERDGGSALRETLRAYFASGCQVSSAAAALGASRQTVTRRLNTAEARLGRALDICRIELESALQLETLEH